MTIKIRVVCCLSIGLALAGCQLIGGTSVSAPTHAADTQQAACQSMLAERERPGVAGLDLESLRLLSWNIKKGSLRNSQQDLHRYARDMDLVLIQEAEESMESQMQRQQAGFWSFAPGFQSSLGLTGVATYSRVAPTARCNLTAYEPWLGTPKATSITRYPLKGRSESLVVVNIHMINFTLGWEAFTQQLATVVDLLKSHRGPIIFSGDFNTWNDGRQLVVTEMMAQLKLQPVVFAKDVRSRVLGAPLDHVYVSGLSVEQADTYAVKSSDHNPIVVSLRGNL